MSSLPMPPVLPPKPRITILSRCVLLDTGRVDIIFDNWHEAIDHAARICRDYRARLTAYTAALAASQTPAPVPSKRHLSMIAHNTEEHR